MKKLLLLSIIFLSLSSSAQIFPLVKDGGIWRHLEYILDPMGPNLNYYLVKKQITMSGDTVLYGKTYKKIYSTNYGAIINKTYGGAIREDSLQRVYTLSYYDSTEFLLYDFSIIPGDTFFTNTVQNPFQILDSIDSVLISGQWRRRFNFKYWGSSQRVWIEGIGSTKNLYFPFLYEFEHYYYLACYEDSNIFWPENTTPHACYTVGIEDKLQIKNNELRIYPNPANNELNIEFPENTNKQNFIISIYNSYGKNVNTFEIQEQKSNINIQDLPSGIYFMQLQTENNVISHFKFIKQ